MFKNLRIGVYALIINKQGRFLVTKTKSKDRYIYNFPGGGVEINEKVTDSLKKELAEECNLNIIENLMKPIYFTKGLHFNTDFPTTQIINLYMLVDINLENKELKAEAEISSLLWMNQKEYLSLDEKCLLSADIEFVKESAILNLEKFNKKTYISRLIFP